MKEPKFEDRLYTFAEIIELLNIEQSHVVEILGKGCLLIYDSKSKDDLIKELNVPESSKDRRIFKLSDVISKKQSNED